MASSTALRPRLRLHFSSPPPRVRHHLVQNLQNPQHNRGQYQHRSISHHLLLELPPAQRHFWSPVADINLEESSEGTEARILVGPAPAVWTMFMFFYSLAGLMAVAGLTLGYAQFLLDQPAWTFWLTPGGLLLLIVLYLLSLAGKHRARHQTDQLLRYLQAALPSAQALAREQA